MLITQDRARKEEWTIAGKLMRGTVRGGLYFITPLGIVFEIGEWVVEWDAEPEPMRLASPQDVTPEVLAHIVARVKADQGCAT